MMQHKIHIAPMMGWTHRHFRVLMRLVGGDALLLFSEMITAQAIVNGDPDHLLAKSDLEGDVVLQLGAGDPELLAQAMAIVEPYNYVSYNLNAGCPSNRVQGADIGACLMEKPDKVYALMRAMANATSKPVSIKTRLGIDGVDSFDYIDTFVRAIKPTTHNWILHARDAWLQGLSPKENRSIPPLRYEYVYQLKEAHPELHITLNGGLKTESAIKEALSHVDAVMIGRAAYQDMPLIHAIGNSPYTYNQALCQYIDYIRQQISERSKRILTAPLISAITGYVGAREHRRLLSESTDVAGILLALDRIEKDLS